MEKEKVGGGTATTIMGEKDMRGNQYKDGAWKLWWEKQFLHAATTRNLKYTHKQEVARFFFC